MVLHDCHRISKTLGSRGASQAPDGPSSQSEKTDEFSTLYICVRDGRVDEFLGPRRGRRGPCLYRRLLISVSVDELLGLLCVPASADTPASRRKDHKYQC